MSRLTKSLREAMLNAILSHAFDAKQKSAEQAKILAGEKIYQDVYGSSLIAMESLPHGFLPRNRYFYIAIAGRMHTVYCSEKRLTGVSHGDRHGTKAKLYVGDEQVAINFQEASELCSDLEKQRNAMSREISPVLESIQTFKKLWEVWPESKSLLEKFEQKPAIAILPAVQVNKLNVALGLPVSTAEEMKETA
ncbi:Nmad5 family putative nucleotide modification protein [Acinetobacter gerneri]|uniref:Nmad5 family putative nucleotide modification protein n=1 Tax=Acinetobacter gerneri TaxID=202952 RepID=UPI0032140001